MNEDQRFVINLNRCTGCQACVLACDNENRCPPDASWRQVHTFNAARHPDLPVFHLSLACNHCAEPACLRNCPVAAYRRDPRTGTVTVDPDRCMGCRYCTWVCPYDAPRFRSSEGVTRKCTFCRERQAEDLPPACAAACPTGALSVEIREPMELDPVPAGFPDTDLEPAIRFIPLRRQGPERAAPSTPELNSLFRRSLPLPAPKITLQSEWTLLVFTWTAAVLVALLTASLTGHVSLPALPFLAAGVVAMGLSTIHLGRPGRAWRAAGNVRHSWLSREIVLFGTFLVLSAAHLLGWPGSGPLGWSAALVGAAALLAIDRVYQVALHLPWTNFHSAQALFTGVFLSGVLIADPVVIVAGGSLKAGLYLARKIRARRRLTRTRLLTATGHLVLGFIGPALLVLFTPAPPVAAIALVLAGELVDRGEFYADLELITPQKQIHSELLRRTNPKIPAASTGK